MALRDTLAKLNADDKKTLLVDIVILPAIEEDKSLSRDEKGDIFLAGKKLGFSSSEIEAALKEQMARLGATEE